jgi:signal transduction histidine kinase
MMNRLWVRLSMAFSAVVLLGVTLIIMVSVFITQSGFRESFILDTLQSPDGLVEQLENYYAAHGNWDSMEAALLRNVDFSLAPRMGLTILITDSQGQIIYSTYPEWQGQKRDVETLPAAVPILVGGQPKGYISLEEEPPFAAFKPGQARLVLEGLSQLLLIIALTGGVIGVLFGVLVSRSLTAPLQRLADAARAVGAQNLSRRVKVEGTVEVAEMAHAFNEMAAALEQTELLRRNLIADVAHELRTPLTVLQGNLLAILDEVYPMDQSEVARLYDQTRLLSRLVSDLHELSQAEANQLSLDLHSIQIDELVKTTAAKFASLAEAEHVTLVVELESDLPPILADNGRLSQVLHNLLNNALRYTSEGGQITISTGRIGDRLRLSIKDTGDGISVEHLPHVFERFYRVDSSRNRNTGGSGLGLAIVKAIVEAHGGRVSAVSEGKPEQGSIFTAELPLIKELGTVEPVVTEVRATSP